MKILSIHDVITMTTGYALQMRQLIPAMVEKFKFEWVTTGYQYPHGVKFTHPQQKCSQVSCSWDGRYPVAMGRVMDSEKPDLVFMMDDVQRVPLWARYFGNTDWLYWFPKDNEDDHPQERKILERIINKVTFSKFAQKFYADRGLLMEYVYNCVDTHIFKPKQVVSQGLKWLDQIIEAKAKGYTILTFVGRPNWRKNTQLLFGVTRELIRHRGLKVKLFMPATDPDDGGADCVIPKDIHAQFLKSSFTSSDPDIIFNPEYKLDAPIHPEIMSAIYNVSDIYISSHGGEGFGVPMAEAMACGIPVIATDYTTTREFTGEHERGIAVPWEYKLLDKGIFRPMIRMDKFADSIQYLIDNPLERRKMGIAGIKYARENFDVDVVATKLGSIIKGFDCGVAQLE